MNDKKEIENYIKNNKIDLDSLVDDYTPYLRTVIQNMVNNNLSEEDKEEIILDTFFVLWKRFKENYSIKSLKYTIYLDLKKVNMKLQVCGQIIIKEAEKVLDIK